MTSLARRHLCYINLALMLACVPIIVAVVLIVFDVTSIVMMLPVIVADVVVVIVAVMCSSSGPKWHMELCGALILART